MSLCSILVTAALTADPGYLAVHGGLAATETPLGGACSRSSTTRTRTRHPIRAPARSSSRSRRAELAGKYSIKLAWGTDVLVDARLTRRQGTQLAKMTRWFTPAETLRMATSGVATPETSFAVIMKDGIIYQNQLADPPGLTAHLPRLTFIMRKALPLASHAYPAMFVVYNRQCPAPADQGRSGTGNGSRLGGFDDWRAC